MKRQEIIDKVSVYLEKEGVQPQGTLLKVEATELTNEFILENLIADFVETLMQDELLSARRQGSRLQGQWVRI